MFLSKKKINGKYFTIRSCNQAGVERGCYVNYSRFPMQRKADRRSKRRILLKLIKVGLEILK